MWRVHQYDFGYGLIRIHGIDLVVTMVAHWAIVGVIFLVGQVKPYHRNHPGT